MGDTIALYEKFSPRVIAPVELRWWLETQGSRMHRARSGQGGTVEADGEVTVTDANHSSSIADTYTGEPTGLVVSLEDGTTLYFAGDTNVFGDMALIRRLYEPSVAVLPIGDHYTMGPQGGGGHRQVARHLALRAVPLGDAEAAHPARRRRCASLHPPAWRSTVESPAERSTYERALARVNGSQGGRDRHRGGNLDFPADALVLEELDGALREAFDAGRPVIVRAGTADEFVPLTPRVSCVVVPDEQRELLEPTFARSPG